jgi:hypothetical protein
MSGRPRGRSRCVAAPATDSTTYVLHALTVRRVQGRCEAARPSASSLELQCAALQPERPGQCVVLVSDAALSLAARVDDGGDGAPFWLDNLYIRDRRDQGWNPCPGLADCRHTAMTREVHLFSAQGGSAEENTAPVFLSNVTLQGTGLHAMQGIQTFRTLHAEGV